MIAHVIHYIALTSLSLWLVRFLKENDSSIRRDLVPKGKVKALGLSAVYMEGVWEEETMRPANVDRRRAGRRSAKAQTIRTNQNIAQPLAIPDDPHSPQGRIEH